LQYLGPDLAAVAGSDKVTADHQQLPQPDPRIARAALDPRDDVLGLGRTRTATWGNPRNATGKRDLGGNN
jgi:hypothetical protein